MRLVVVVAFVGLLPLVRAGERSFLLETQAYTKFQNAHRHGELRVMGAFQLHDLGLPRETRVVPILYGTQVKEYENMVPDGEQPTPARSAESSAGAQMDFHVLGRSNAWLRLRVNDPNRNTTAEMRNVDVPCFVRQGWTLRGISDTIAFGSHVRTGIWVNICFKSVFSDLLPVSSHPPTTIGSGDSHDWTFSNNPTVAERFFTENTGAVSKTRALDLCSGRSEGIKVTCV
jgi:hypothetical protein